MKTGILVEDDVMFKIIIGLVFFVVLIIVSYYLNKKVKAGNFGKRKSKYIESIDRLAIANDKWMEIIIVNKKVFLLGITTNMITTIKEFRVDDFDLKEEVQSNSSFSRFFGAQVNRMKEEKIKKEDGK